MIKEIFFTGDEIIYCKSRFYNAQNQIRRCNDYKFVTGVNKFVEEIDSGAWGVDYLFAMYEFEKKPFLSNYYATVDGKQMHLKDLTKRCCYMDEGIYPLFKSKHKSVYKMITLGIKKSGIKKSPQEICDMFKLTSERINRPIRCVGNERFRAMAAIGYAYGKEVFCFPWLSNRMATYYGKNLSWLLDLLEKLNVISILPVGQPY